MSVIIMVPSIESATITPNPVNQNAAYSISALVIEVQVVIEPFVRYCGAFLCGEEGIE